MTPPPLHPPPLHRRCAGSVRVEILLLLALLPAAGLLFLTAEERRLRDAQRFAGPRGSLPEQERRRRGEFFRLIAAAGCIILALARPSWSEVPVSTWRDGRDLVFLLDVSRSMLAQDLVPDRLSAAKTAIRDCVESLQGDRVALVVFAGSTSILCPLTSDYAFFYDKLEEAHPDFVAPGDVRVGGTRIGDAIHKICDKLLTGDRRGFQDLILLSDGGDQDSNPVRAAQRLESLGVHFLVAGLGDSVTGARIPARDGSGEGHPFVQFQGREVWTRLEADGLDKLAKSCRYGVFLNAGTRTLPLGEIYGKLASHFQRHHTGDREDLMRRQETFPLFLGLALLCLAAPLRRARRSPPASHPGSLAAVLLALLSVIPFPEAAASPGKSQFREGLKQWSAKNFTGALDSFRAAAEAFPDSERRAAALYNAGLACFEQALNGEILDPLSSQTYYRQSCDCFRAALEMVPTLDDARWNLELALRRLARISREVEEPEADPKQDPEKAKNPNADRKPSENEGEEENVEESDAESASQPSSQMSGENAMDLNAKDIPPPMVEPEDLFEQERESDGARQRNAAANYRPVEKDW